MTPRVSVVIPTYNRSRALVRAVDSVLAQTEPALEIIVVDDGSTDDTQAVLRRYGGKVWSILKSNGGAGAARNAGIEAARGEFVAFLDDDDAWLPDKLREQARILDEHPQVGLTSTGAVFLDGQERLDYVQSWSVEGQAFDRVLFHNPVVTSSAMARRSCLMALPSLFRTDLAPVEDWELWIRLCARYEVIVVSRPLVRYYATPASAFRKAGPDRSLETYRRMYDGLLLDPVVGPKVQSQWSRVLANVHFLAGARLYGRGEGLRARWHLVRSVLKHPWHVRWRTVLSMLALPMRVRSWLRSRVTRRRAP